MIRSAEDLSKALQTLGYKNQKRKTSKHIVVLTAKDRREILQKITDGLKREGAVWDKSKTSVSGFGAIRVGEYTISVKPTTKSFAGGANEHQITDGINRAIKEFGSPLTIEFVPKKQIGKKFIVKDVLSARHVGLIGSKVIGTKADIHLITNKGIPVPISLKQDNASFWQWADKWSLDAKNWIDQLVHEKKVELIPNGSDGYNLSPKVAWKANTEDTEKVVFGTDIKGHGAVVIKTFFQEDFTYDGEKEVLVVKCSSVILTVADILDEYKAWFAILNYKPGRHSKLYPGLRVAAIPQKKVTGPYLKVTDTYSTGGPPAQPKRAVVFAFGRMNPPTLGHKKLINKVKETASKVGGDYKLYVSQTQDAKKNPLSYEIKHQWLKKVFPDVDFVKDTSIKTPFDVLAKLVENYNEMYFVVGGDRVEDFKKMMLPYVNNPKNPKSIVLEKFEIVNAGERDPDSEDVSGMSASKMRKAAADNQIELFRTGLPKMVDQDVLSLFNEVRRGMRLEEYKEAKSNIPAPKTELVQKKNTHLEHIEDRILDEGKNGAKEAIDFLASLIGMMKGHAASRVNVTTKWDGAPAIICGIDPQSKKFFVGTKSVFAKVNPKLNFTDDDIKRNHGDAPTLVEKLKLALKYFPDLGITGVLQGDFLFSDKDLKSEVIEQQKYLTFRPNTITYTVPEDSELAKTLKVAKLGVVFHTSYFGPTIERMSASFGADASKLKKTPDVWVIDANIKDVSGEVTFTDQETKELQRMLAMAKSTFSAISSSFYVDLKKNKNLIPYIKTFINAGIRTGTVPTAEQLANYVDAKYIQQISALKTEKGRLDKAKEQAALRDFLKKEKINFEKLFLFWNQITSCKLKLLKKLQQIKTIGTFLQTPEGFKPTAPEGFVAIDHMGRAIKLVDRMEFSRANFTVEKDWVKGK
jgi:hypothetical protein